MWRTNREMEKRKPVADLDYLEEIYMYMCMLTLHLRISNSYNLRRVTVLGVRWNPHTEIASSSRLLTV